MNQAVSCELIRGGPDGVDQSGLREALVFRPVYGLFLYARGAMVLARFAGPRLGDCALEVLAASASDWARLRQNSKALLLVDALGNAWIAGEDIAWPAAADGEAEPKRAREWAREIMQAGPLYTPAYVVAVDARRKVLVGVIRTSYWDDLGFEVLAASCGDDELVAPIRFWAIDRGGRTVGDRFFPGELT